MKQAVTTIDDNLEIYEARDLSSPLVARPPKGATIQLGSTEVFEGRLWMEATLENSGRGYALGPTVRGHTTLGATPSVLSLPNSNLVAKVAPSSPPNLNRVETVAPTQRERESKNAGLWNCSACDSPGTGRAIASRRFFSGEVCNGCGRVLCQECVSSLTSHICKCGGLFVPTPFDLSKEPLRLTAVGARAKGEMPESVKLVFSLLFIIFLIGLTVLAVTGIAGSNFPFLRYTVITIGIVVASVGFHRKNGLLFLGAAIITTGQMFFK